MQKWQEIKEKYTKRLVGQDVEDILARRIWRGLGLAGSVKDIYSVEKQLFGECSANDPLYDRVFAIFKFCYKSKYGKFNLRCDTLEIKSHNEVLERIPFIYGDINGVNDKTVFLTKNLNATIAYIIEPENTLSNYKPPYCVLGYDDQGYSAYVVYMDVSHFIEQYGPYPALEGVGRVSE